VPDALGMFNSSRLVLARRRRGLTKTQLAKAVDVDRRMVNGYESGEYIPGSETLSRLSAELKFPEAFFFGDDLEEVVEETASFRSMSKMTAGQRNMALGQGAIALLFNRWVERRFELPPVALPDLRHERDPEAAAAAVRQHWGLGQQPIKNLVHLLESKGVRVFSLSIDAAEVDAFSMWKDTIPFVFLNTRKSAEHSRFDAAHELGHLLLHRHAAPAGREAEAEADAFASAFLMPRGSILAHAPRFVTLEQLIRLKRIWTVSLSALTYRLHAVRLLSDWHYRGLCIEISQRGFRKREPEEAPRESSQALAKVFAALRADGLTKNDIAAQVGVHPSEIDQLAFGLMLVSLTDTAGDGAVRGGTTARLRLVK
jgi:Zn-dependent peptidase ImmA (M78 family)/transcriptional regulator with XRE-family HTH domain